MSKKVQKDLSRKETESTADSFQSSLQEITNFSMESGDDGDPTAGEKALWRAVITQALMDAGSQSNKTEMQYEQARAVSWLSGLSEDFKTVCMLADLEPVYVRSKSHDAIIRGCTWRKDIRLKERFAKLKSRKKTSIVEIQRQDEIAEIVMLTL